MLTVPPSSDAWASLVGPDHQREDLVEEEQRHDEGRRSGRRRACRIRARSSRRWSESAIRPSSPTGWRPSAEEPTTPVIDRTRPSVPAWSWLLTRTAAAPPRCAARSRAARASWSSSSVVRPLVSSLKMRSARPVPRASSGSFLAPKSRMTTRTTTMSSHPPGIARSSGATTAPRPDPAPGRRTCSSPGCSGCSAASPSIPSVTTAGWRCRTTCASCGRGSCETPSS